jgi:hypothetical protein
MHVFFRHLRHTGGHLVRCFELFNPCFSIFYLWPLTGLDISTSNLHYHMMVELEISFTRQGLGTGGCPPVKGNYIYYLYDNFIVMLAHTAPSGATYKAIPARILYGYALKQQDSTLPKEKRVVQ